jgi:prepilin-type N-terminal cleavage/methylation domain-containing protein
MGMRRRTLLQAGFTLVELLVVTFLLGAIGAISLAAFNSGSQTLGRVDDDIRGQQDLRIVTETLTRDIRAGRGIDATSTASSLSIWIDYDADYLKDTATEVILWDVVAAPSDPDHFDVRRTVGTGTPRVVGRAVIDALAFKYFENVAGASTERTGPGASVTTAQIVEVSMDYDAIVGAYLQQKTNTYRIRLRNTE